MSHAIQVMVVDHAQDVSRLLAAHRHLAPDVQVLGTALSGTRALELLKERHPDVILLNLDIPDMEGLTVLDHIMHEHPTPVVLISHASPHTVARTMEAVKMGAVDFLLTDTPEFDTDPAARCRTLLQKLRAAARVRVVRSLRSRQPTRQPQIPTGKAGMGVIQGTRGGSSPEGVIVIGASTGGPTALRELLSVLPTDFSAALLLVQHMPEAFTAVLAAQLDRYTAVTVREAVDGDRLEAGIAFVAPGGMHLRISAAGCVQLSREAAVGGHRPAIDVTMQSVAEHCGVHARGVILTGMGADGAMGLVAIHTHGGLTFAQDAASCVVDGMPQQARATGIVDYVDTPTQIGRRLLKTPWKSRRPPTW